jgi:hypothetical protein
MTAETDRSTMPFAVARTRDEAHLYLELHPCEDCGSVDTEWEHGLAEADGELVSSYVGVCPGCGMEREYLFGLPEKETAAGAFPTFGGPEPSELLDAGQWLEVADLSASDVPAGDRAAAARVLSVARAAVEEVLKFIPAGRAEVPDDAFWTDEGRRVRDAEPGRFRLDRLLVIRDTYRTLALEGR